MVLLLHATGIAPARWQLTAAPGEVKLLGRLYLD
jgi:hypothetical protein